MDSTISHPRTGKHNRRIPDQRGIQTIRNLPDNEFDALWESIILADGIKDRLLSQAVWISPHGLGYRNLPSPFTGSSYSLDRRVQARPRSHADLLRALPHPCAEALRI